jgi:hypothetical protein
MKKAKSLSDYAKRNPKKVMKQTPKELRHLYKGESNSLYMWPLPPRGELPW